MGTAAKRYFSLLDRLWIILAADYRLHHLCPHLQNDSFFRFEEVTLVFPVIDSMDSAAGQHQKLWHLGIDQRYPAGHCDRDVAGTSSGTRNSHLPGEYAPRRVRSTLKPILEILAGIPMVYGFFALMTITPFLQWCYDGFNIYNAMSAGIAVGILCFPTVCSLAEDALQAVPSSLRDGAFGLGGTRFDATIKVILPAALSGIISAFLLAIARAIGETMIVALAAGSRAHVTINPGDEVQTMTGYMVQIAGGDVSNFGIEYYSMYAVAFTLFLITLSLTMIGNRIRKKYRETYD